MWYIRIIQHHCYVGYPRNDYWRILNKKYSMQKFQISVVDEACVLEFDTLIPPSFTNGLIAFVGG